MKAKKFEQFLNEAHGYSNSVKEYAIVCKEVINHHFKRYLDFNFKKGVLTNFSVPIVIDDAYSEVSQAVSRDFPIDRIMIDFKIVVSKEYESMNYSGHYRRQYDKVKLTKGKDEKVNIEIMCTVIISRKEMQISVETANEYIDDILSHELTHAYNDYKNPKGIVATFPYLMNKLEDYDFSKNSEHLKKFIFLIYALSDDEINAMTGERETFKSKMRLNSFSGARIARDGIRFDPKRYYLKITDDLQRNNYPAIDYVIDNFGEVFVKEYKEVAKDLKIKPDPKILKLKKTATLDEVLEYFGKIFNRQGKKLLTKLGRKIEGKPFNKSESPNIP